MHRWTEKCKKEVTVDATPPTVSTESVLTTEIIDVHEGRDVRICNILGAFFSADIEEDMKMALRGRLSALIVKIVPQVYRQHMIYEKRRPVIYVTLNKALYGCLRSALLLYECLVSYMKGKGFEINSYYPCKENTMI